MDRAFRQCLRGNSGADPDNQGDAGDIGFWDHSFGMCFGIIFGTDSASWEDDVYLSGHGIIQSTGIAESEPDACKQDYHIKRVGRCFDLGV